MSLFLGRHLLGDADSALGSRYETEMFPQKLGEGQFSKAVWKRTSHSISLILDIESPSMEVILEMEFHIN